MNDHARYVIMTEYFPKNPRDADHFDYDTSNKYSKMGLDNEDGTFTRARPAICADWESAYEYKRERVLTEQRYYILCSDELQGERAWIEELDEDLARETDFFARAELIKQ